MTLGASPQILVAGIGNAWLRDDGFGGEVAKRMQAMRAARRRVGRGLRHGRAGPRLRGHARLRRADPDRRHRAGAASRPARCT